MIDVALEADTIDGMVQRAMEVTPDDRAMVLVGCSLGGIVALALHRQHPQRVAGLALIASTSRPPRPEQAAGWRAQSELADDDLPGLVRDLLLPRELMLRAEDAGAADTVLAMARSVGPTTFARQLMAQETRVDERVALRSCRVPVLAVAGARDVICPVGLHQEIATLAPTSDLVVVPGAGHLIPLDAPEAVTNSLQAWLTTRLDLPPTKSIHTTPREDPMC